MRIVFMGTPEFALTQLSAILSAGHEVALVVTQPDRPSGRGRKTTQSAVETFALAAGLPVIAPADVNAPEVIARIASVKSDLAVVAAFGQKLSRELIALPRLGFYNVHASLLPKYRGAAPINWALINGDPVTGVTVQTVAYRFDSGAIAAQETLPIDPAWNAGDLTHKLAQIGARLLVEVLAQVAAGTLQLRPQHPDAITRAPRLAKSDGIIDWSRSAREVHNRVRGVTPWPGAQTWHVEPGGRVLQLLLVQTAVAQDEGTQAAPGEVTAVSDAGFEVACGKGVLRVLKLKPAGKREMTAGEFARGHRLQVGEVFSASSE